MEFSKVILLINLAVFSCATITANTPNIQTSTQKSIAKKNITKTEEKLAAPYEKRSFGQKVAKNSVMGSVVSACVSACTIFGIILGGWCGYRVVRKFEGK